MMYIAYGVLIVACIAMFYFDMVKRDELDKTIIELKDAIKLLDAELLKVKSDNKKVTIIKRTKSHEKPS